MPFLNQHAARIKSPGQYDKFARKNIAPGIDIILGIKGNTSETQAYRFDKNKFTVKQARAWLKEHNVKIISFESASAQESILKSFSESLNFKEAKLQRRGSKWEIVIIESGKSYNGFYYSNELLKESTNIFEGIEVYTHKFGETLDHRDDENTDPNGMVLNKVGWVENVRYKSDGAKSRLVGDFIVINSTLGNMLANTWQENKNQMPEFSIDVIGNGYNDGNRKVVTEFKKANSLDMVSHASAGGKFERMVASKNKENEMKELLEKLLMLVKEGKMKMQKSIEGKSDDEIKSMIKESLEIKKENILEANVKSILEKIANLPDMKSVKAAIAEALKNVKNVKEGEEEKTEETKEEEKTEKKTEEKVEEKTEEKTEEKKEEVKDVEEKVEKIEEKLKVTESRILIKEEVSNDPVLPEASKTRIMESLDGRIMSRDEVKAELKKEKDYLETLTGSGEIKINESKFIKVTDVPVDKMQRAMDMLVDPDLAETPEYKDTPQFFTLRESFEKFTGMNIQEARRVCESGQTEQLRIKEATTANFPIALGTSMNKKMVKMYKMYKDREGWTKVVREETFNNLNQQDLSRFGGFGLLSTVAESGTYPALTTPSEENPNYTPIKKGGYFFVTEEMLINDNLRSVRRFPQEMALAASRTLTTFVWNLITGCSGSSGLNSQNIYDGGLLYTNAHGNLGATALGYQSFNAGVTAMNNYTQTSSAAPVWVDPKYLVTVPTLRRTALNICKNPLIEAGAASGAGSIKNVLEGYGVEPIIVPNYYLCSSTTGWYLIADPTQCPTAVIGYLTGKKNPEIILQDNPTVATVFTNDRLTYRVKFRYGGTIEDWRGFYGYPV
jgi:hypothetical protein